MPISPGDIEISHQLSSQTKPIIVEFLIHKLKSSLYKKGAALKDITVSDLFPTYPHYAASLGRGNRIFLKETSQPIGLSVAGNHQATTVSHGSFIIVSLIY